MNDRLCPDHRNLNPDYGTCAPLHWPTGARKHRGYAEAIGYEEKARDCRKRGRTRAAADYERKAREARDQ